jgi:hypothetical protein
MGETSRTDVDPTVKINLHFCPECGTIYSQYHSKTKCECEAFRKEAYKYGMVALIDTYPKLFVYLEDISSTLKDIYPKVVSKPFNENVTGDSQWYEIFVEEWAAKAINTYYSSMEHHGMALAEFLTRVYDERHFVKSR